MPHPFPYNPTIAAMVDAGKVRQMRNSEAKLLLVLQRFSDSQGRAWPSVATMSDLAGLNRRNTQRNLRSLQGLGALKLGPQTGPGLPSRGYQIVAPEGAALPTPPGRRRRRGRGGAGDARGAAQATPKLDHMNETIRTTPQEPAGVPPEVCVSDSKELENAAAELGISPVVLSLAVQAHGKERTKEVLAECARRHQQGKITSPQGWVKRALDEQWDLKNVQKPLTRDGRDGRDGPGGASQNGPKHADYMTPQNRAAWEGLDEPARAKWLAMFKKTHPNPMFTGWITNAENGKPSNSYVEWIRGLMRERPFAGIPMPPVSAPKPRLDQLPTRRDPSHAADEHAD